MKATTIISAALLTLQVSVLFAGNESTSFTSAPVGTELNLSALVPVTPAEATFEEVGAVAFDLDHLAPVVPVEADFSETSEQMIDISKLAPTAPAVAVFE